MDRTYPPDAWKRLGRALELRRLQLGYGFRKRGRFARDRGSPVSVKTLSRLERGERDAYPDATIASVEALYGLAPGSIEISLKGGEFVILEDDPGTVTTEGLTEEQRATVRALVELLRRGQDSGTGEQRGA